MKENWGKEGMPPVWVEVLDKKIIKNNNGLSIERSWIKGDHPHLGKLHNGWQGNETIVDRLLISYRKILVK
jgi:hypothetical protein